MTDDMKFSGVLNAESYLASILSASEDAIMSHDLEGYMTSWNRGAENIFGYSQHDIIGRHINMLIPPDLVEEQENIVEKAKSGGCTKNYETVRRKKDGNLIELSIIVTPIHDAKGDVFGVLKIARDITQLRLADRTSAYLGAIVESSDDAIISKDLNGFITSWNQSAERIFGYSASEAIGRHISFLIPTDRANEEEGILTTLKTGLRIDHFETVRRHKDGHLINVSLTVSPIKDRNGHIIGASKVSRDISERLKSDEALREMSRKKDEFLANMSHELRTPMNAVIGIASILKDIDGVPNHVRKLIDTLKFSANNMMDLVNDLLDFSKIEADAFGLENVEFSLSEQIGKVVSVLAVKAEEKGLALRTHFSPSADRHFLGDPLRLNQVILNLLSNAVKFTDKGAVDIEVEGKKRADSDIVDLLIKVTDTGIGIPENMLENIFEKFTQADSSITRRYGGSGLGLTISKAIVEKMGGNISVQSQLGKGTSFIIELPLVSVISSEDQETLEISSSIKEAVNRDVLLVEDYEPNILVASTMLENLGFNYDIARNGIEALRAFAKRNYDVILMDIQMPDFDGLEATRRIRQIETIHGISRTPIVAVTAHVREQDKAACLEAGMDDFLPKPFDSMHLGQKIRNFMSAEKQRHV
jgi:PAS domain S-box-containing protein